MGSIKQAVDKGEGPVSTKIRVFQLPPADFRPEVDQGIKLHLGCGFQRWTGWVNIDGFDGGGTNRADVTGDITKLEMYEADSVEEIMLIHVFEHLYTWEAAEAVKRWYEILKPGGRLTIEVPCII